MQETPFVHIQCMVKQRKNLIENAKRHGIEVHGYTEESFQGEMAKNLENFRKLIKTT